MSFYTAETNEKSIETVRAEIKRKTSRPFLANGKIISNVITDHDHHPYSRFFRGVYYYDDPVIVEREAGFRPIENSCYDMIAPPQPVDDFKLCFEPPCNTIFPCNPSSSYEDREKREKYVDRMCLVQYY